MKKILTLGMAVLAMAGTGCNKDGDDKNATPQVPVRTKTDLLTTGKWQISEQYELYITATDTQKLDYFEDVEDCDKDNTITFATDGTVKFDYGTIMCDSSEKDENRIVTWTFLDNDTRIVITERSYKDTMNVELTESMLRFTSIYYDDVGKGHVHDVQGFKNVK